MKKAKPVKHESPALRLYKVARKQGTMECRKASLQNEDYSYVEVSLLPHAGGEPISLWGSDYPGTEAYLWLAKVARANRLRVSKELIAAVLRELIARAEKEWRAEIERKHVEEIAASSREAYRRKKQDEKVQQIQNSLARELD